MNLFWLVLSYLIVESIINGVFHIVSRKLKSDEKRGRSILKGVLERLFLVVGLVLGYPQVIIAFGALKIGTRFQRSSNVSNDYFLIGNFISLLTAILYSQLAIFLMN
ncbi:hypothetical protein [Rhodohalobacter sulfatireducens]|uniref:Uncharacterized protein n=1 Tax=Rhodohalobacter sulfatireducens TaxID=2911366 RepID=A0ABS9K8X1_9BACT|nr:hypothetical protein [Rhodohalobacter sulfatireducens]MCG2587253.1 hypothetical protein [Rhodohalobacter sulfatireducens]MDR9367081.1 hypothetical protein [Balneolaceae bacterium]MDR9408373.1 hypothetical protein [Balneolaceae bacterium]